MYDRTLQHLGVRRITSHDRWTEIPPIPRNAICAHFEQTIFEQILDRPASTVVVAAMRSVTKAVNFILAGYDNQMIFAYMNFWIQALLFISGESSYSRERQQELCASA